jgi:hypothetical protein
LLRISSTLEGAVRNVLMRRMLLIKRSLSMEKAEEVRVN